MNTVTSLALAVLLLTPLAEAVATAPSRIRPGQPWLDTQGVLINAHGFQAEIKMPQSQRIQLACINSETGK